jgi:hypothetical protein
MKEVNYPGVNKNDGKYSIEINSLDDLEKIENSFEEVLIISMRYKTIEIYDDYRE